MADGRRPVLGHWAELKMLRHQRRSAPGHSCWLDCFSPWAFLSLAPKEPPGKLARHSSTGPRSSGGNLRGVAIMLRNIFTDIVGLLSAPYFG